MKKMNNSYADERGRAFYRHTGRYNEVTKEAIGKIPNDSSDITYQNNLGPSKNKTAAAATLQAVIKELGW